MAVLVDNDLAIMWFNLCPFIYKDTVFKVCSLGPLGKIGTNLPKIKKGFFTSLCQIRAYLYVLNQDVVFTVCSLHPLGNSGTKIPKLCEGFVTSLCKIRAYLFDLEQDLVSFLNSSRHLNQLKTQPTN